MEKWGFLKAIACAMPAIMVVFTFSCTEENDDQLIQQPNNQFEADGITVTSAGGIITALGGEVTLNFPADAVAQPTRFSVAVLMERGRDENSGNEISSNLAIHAILIEPSMVFNKPVQVSLKYGGCLCNGVIINEEMHFSASIWKNEVSYLKNVVPCACTSCLMSADQGTICMCICQSGVIAVQFD